MTPKHVLIVTPEFPPRFGGIGTHCYEMARNWRDYVNVTVLATAAAEPRFTLSWPFRVIDVPPSGSRFLRLWRLTVALRRLLSEGDIDVAYIAHWRTSGVPFRVATLLSLSRPRYIQAIHGAEVLYFIRPGPIEALSRLLFEWTTREADMFIALGRYQAELLDDLAIERRRVFVSPEGVDVSSFELSDGDAAIRRLRRQHGLDGKRVLLTVARLSEIKGHDMVIRALPTILRDVPDALYLIVGSGAREADLRRLADVTGVAQHVRFCGFVPQRELATYYRLCDLFIMPSRETKGDTEGFGIVFMEAAACAKPTIGGRTGGIVEAIQEGETGMLVDPTSPADIARAAVTLLTDQELARRMGDAGRRRVLAEFQYRDIARNILAAGVGESRWPSLRGTADPGPSVRNTLS